MTMLSRNGVRALLAAGAVALGVVLVPVAPGASSTPWLWQSCSHVHTKYHHGVGKRHAYDRTWKSSQIPVTNFYRSTRLYDIAMHYNRSLDGDRDGIACEKH